jgi:hypothetical protein
MAHSGIATPEQGWFTSWLHATSGRRSYILPRRLPGETGYVAGHLRDPNGDGNLSDTLWPLTLPPVFSQPGGTIPAGSTLGIAHSAPAGSVIHYTLDGSDPRLWGGAVAPAAAAFSGPIPLLGSALTVKARVKNGTTGEWSPLTEALFRVGTVPASAANLVVGELMYHPPDPTAEELAAGFTDADDFEFLALLNIGDAPVDASGLRFTAGITFDFATALRSVVEPGGWLVVGRNRDALRHRYGPAAVDPIFAGEFFGGLDNAGETLRLQIAAAAEDIRTFAYDDNAPWPAAADGSGPSLVLADPASNPDHNHPASWTLSAGSGGRALGPIPTTYSAWSAGVFSPADLADPAISGPLADPDRDNWPNLAEWALAGNPTDPRHQPRVDGTVTPLPDGSQHLDLTFDRRPGLGGVTLTPEWSSSLSAWAGGFTRIDAATLPDGTTRETWRITTPPGTRAAFGHIRIDAP